ncbi:MAG: ribosome recycling factor [Vulcanimicrobiota bacterium]
MDTIAFDDYEEKMMKSIESLGRDFAAVRSGRASPALVEKVMVEAYGTEMPLNQVASISVPEARLLVIQPFDKNNIAAIERAIHKSDLGINPSNDGSVIRLGFPALTEERRKDLVKMVKKRAEEARVSIRNIRRDAMEDIKKVDGVPEDEVKRSQDQVQKLTDRYVDEIDRSLDNKEKEIMEV